MITRPGSLLSRMLIALAATAVGRAAPGSPVTRPPNIVFILADDLGWAPVACYGNPYYQTPHLDRIAREGMRFTAAYAACPVCSPTRAALMTGLYPARVHLTDFIPGNGYPTARLSQPDWQRFLPLSADTLAEEFQTRGYRTAIFGKWHLARGYFPPESLPEGPDRQGFDETLVTYKPKPKHDPERDAHNVDAITARGLRFLEEHQDDGPFFLELAHNSIHAPIMAPRALVAKYRARAGSDRPENNPVIGAMMERFDDGVGLILAKLDELGLSDHTLVVFYSDNGGLLSDAAQTPFRGGKAQLYEGGIRVPLLMRWPGVIAPGSVSDVPVTTPDFFPTLLAVSGHPLAPGVTTDGVSLLPVMRGGKSLPRDAIFWHYPHYHPAGIGGPAGAVREGDWKLIEYDEATLTGTGRPTELFNLRADPAEMHNLAAAEPARVAALAKHLAAWRASVGAQMPSVNPAAESARPSAAGAGAGD